jgi:thiamine kinase-like enzyme
MSEPKLPIEWSEIEKELDNLRTVDGGFSQAQRGLLTLPDGTHVFVKLGLHENTKRWAKKEIAVYRFLKKHSYSYIPELLAANDDESGFVITAHTPEDGWDWKENWTEERVDKTLEAMDTLAALQPEGDDLSFFSHKAIDESDDGWKPLLDSTDLQSKLLEKLRKAGKSELADNLDFTKEAKWSSQFAFQTNVLVHNDVRADNCAWSATTNEVRLVDWNWTQLGDRRIDLAATLTYVQKSGFDILPKYADRLDADALHWMAGFWFKSAATPIWEGGPEHLRDFQLLSGLTALDLTTRVTE